MVHDAKHVLGPQGIYIMVMCLCGKVHYPAFSIYHS
jgi:hypothetical protein